MLSSGKPLLVEWDPGTNDDAEVVLLLNISKHGGSAGYMRCDTDDSGSFTIPAGPIQALIDLGVAGFPQLTLTRRTRGEAAVTGGKIAFDVAAVAIPDARSRRLLLLLRRHGLRFLLRCHEDRLRPVAKALQCALSAFCGARDGLSRAPVRTFCA